MKKPPPLPPLTPDEEQILGEALLLWRYVGHRLVNNGGPNCNSETRAHLAMRLAKRLGLFVPYWRLMQAEDVLSVTVRNLDTEPRRHGGGRPKKPAKA